MLYRSHSATKFVIYGMSFKPHSWLWHCCSAHINPPTKAQVIHWHPLLDGPRGGRSGEEGRLQPAVWHMGSRHHCHRTGGDTTTYVWPASNEVRIIWYMCVVCTCDDHYRMLIIGMILKAGCCPTPISVFTWSVKWWPSEHWKRCLHD